MEKFVWVMPKPWQGMVPIRLDGKLKLMVHVPMLVFEVPFVWFILEIEKFVGKQQLPPSVNSTAWTDVTFCCHDPPLIVVERSWLATIVKSTISRISNFPSNLIGTSPCQGLGITQTNFSINASYGSAWIPNNTTDWLAAPNNCSGNTTCAINPLPGNDIVIAATANITNGVVGTPIFDVVTVSDNTTCSSMYQ